MRIRKVHIQGFRSIKEPLELNLEQVNALIGANNCGKSNILSAIYRVLGRDWVTKNTFFENDVYNEDYDTDIIIDFEFDEPFQYEQYVGIPVEIPKVRFFYTRYKKGENSGERRLEKQCLQLNNKAVFGFKSRRATSNGSVDHNPTRTSRSISSYFYRHRPKFKKSTSE